MMTGRDDVAIQMVAAFDLWNDAVESTEFCGLDPAEAVETLIVLAFQDLVEALPAGVEVQVVDVDGALVVSRPPNEAQVIRQPFTNHVFSTFHATHDATVLLQRAQLGRLSQSCRSTCRRSSKRHFGQNIELPRTLRRYAPGSSPFTLRTGHGS